MGDTPTCRCARDRFVSGDRAPYASAMRCLFVVCLFALAACEPSPTEAGPHYLYSADAQSLDNPFPDARLVEDGVTTLRPKWYRAFLPQPARTREAIAYFERLTTDASTQLHGFGGLGGTLLRPSEPLDAASVQGTFARVVKTADGWRVLERPVRAQHVRDVLREQDREVPDGFPEYVFVRPSVPLPNEADGALVVLRGAKTVSGAVLTRPPDFSTPELVGIAAALQVAVTDVLLVLPERGPRVVATLRSLADWAALNPPAVDVPAHGTVDDGDGARPVGVWRMTDSDWSTLQPYLERQGFGRPATAVGAVVLGSFGARDLRESDVVRADWLAQPDLAPIKPLRFVLTVPVGAKPAGGWPLVLGQHGVGGRNTPRVGSNESYCLEWGHALAARGLACLGIDAPNHGSRGNFIHFFSMENLPALRDRFREMAFDLLQVEQAAARLDVDGDGTPDFQPQVRYFGNSLGAILGANFVPVSKRVSSAVLNVPGGGLSNLITSHYLRDRLGLLLTAQTAVPLESPEFDAMLPLFRVIAQPFFEEGDPVNVAEALPADRAVLQQLGVNDLTIPNDTSEDLALAMGLPAAAAAMGGATPLQVLVRVDAARFLPAEEAARFDGHEVLWKLAAPREQALRFLESDGRELTW